MKNKLNVVMSGLVFPVTMMHYFWRALERRDDVNLFVLGPFFDNWIPWSYPGDPPEKGMFVQRKYVKVPDLPLPTSFYRTEISPSIIANRIPQDVDLWLQVDAGWHFATRPPAKVVALLETDPHVLKDFYIKPAFYSDIVFCMQSNYAKEGEIYLPYAYDKEIHRHMDIPKDTDFCLIGLHYPQRDALVDALRKRGYSVHYGIGEVYQEFALQYNKSKVAISWSSRDDLPARVWEAIGMGIPLVCNYVPDLEKIFTDEVHYLGFENLDGAIKQCVSLIESQQKLDEMSANQLELCKNSYHTYDDRVDYMLWKMGLGEVEMRKHTQYANSKI